MVDPVVMERVERMGREERLELIDVLEESLDAAPDSSPELREYLEERVRLADKRGAGSGRPLDEVLVDMRSIIT